MCLLSPSAVTPRPTSSLRPKVGSSHFSRASSHFSLPLSASLCLSPPLPGSCSQHNQPLQNHKRRPAGQERRGQGGAAEPRGPRRRSVRTRPVCQARRRRLQLHHGGQRWAPLISLVPLLISLCLSLPLSASPRLSPALAHSTTNPCKTTNAGLQVKSAEVKAAVDDLAAQPGYSMTTFRNKGDDKRNAVFAAKSKSKQASARVCHLRSQRPLFLAHIRTRKGQAWHSPPHHTRCGHGRLQALPKVHRDAVIQVKQARGRLGWREPDLPSSRLSLLRPTDHLKRERAQAAVAWRSSQRPQRLEEAAGCRATQSSARGIKESQECDEEGE
jgi:hypothetical protein